MLGLNGLECCIRRWLWPLRSNSLWPEDLRGGFGKKLCPEYLESAQNLNEVLALVLL